MSVEAQWDASHAWRAGAPLLSVGSGAGRRSMIGVRFSRSRHFTPPIIRCLDGTKILSFGDVVGVLSFLSPFLTIPCGSAWTQILKANSKLEFYVK